MALLWADGFDHYGNTNEMSKNYGRGEDLQWYPEADARTGTGCFRGKDYGYLIRPIPIRNTIVTGVAMNHKVPAVDDKGGCLWLRSGNNHCAGFRLIAGGAIQIYRQNVLLATTAPDKWTANTYPYFEFRVFSDPVNGTIELRVNNNVVFQQGGLNTGPGTMDSVNWGNAYSFIHGGSPCFYDDVYILDTTGAYNNDFLGDVRCRTQFAVSNGPEQDWDATGVPAYSQIDNVPYNPAQYVSADTVGDISNFGHEPLPTNTAYVAAVQMFAVISKTDAGACEVEMQMKTAGGVVASGAPISPGTGDGYYSASFDVNPETGNPFTRLEFDAALLQIERTA